MFNIGNYKMQAAKTGLARLLAGENLMVRYLPKISTASFDLKSRVVSIPLWKEMSEELHDLFTGHEIFHALETPVDEYKKLGTELSKKYKFDVSSILNVLEDVRINKKAVVRYPGLTRDFRLGYIERFTRGDYGVTPKTLADKPFIDRVNMHYKIGHHVLIPFKEHETVLLNKIGKLNKWEEIGPMAIEVLDFMLKENAFDQMVGSMPDLSFGDLQIESDPSGDSGNSISIQISIQQPASSEDEEKEQSDGSSEDSGSFGKEDDSSEDSGSSGKEDGSSGKEAGNTKSESKGSQSGSDAESDSEGSSDNTDIKKDGSESDDKKEPKKSASSNVNGSGAGSKKITISIENMFSSTDVQGEQSQENYVSQKETSIGYIGSGKAMMNDRVIVDYKNIMAGRNKLDNETITKMNKQFIDENKTVLDVMVQEFERKKAAEEFQRSKTAKTGSLDMKKLYSYRTSEDIFKMVQQVPTGKNHGFFIVIDGSSSMNTVMKSVYKKAILFAMFCRRIGVPFEIYSFHTSYGGYSHMDIDYSSKYEGSYVYEGGSFTFCNIFSSRMKLDEFRLATAQVLNGTFSKKEAKNSTPLDPAILVTRELVKEYIKTNRIEFMNVVFITDGGSDGNLNITSASTVIDIQTNKMYKRNEMARRNYDITRILLENLKDQTGCKLIGFFLTKSLTKMNVLNFATDVSAEDKNIDLATNDFLKNGYAEWKNYGYDEYYFMDSSILNGKERKIENLEKDVDALQKTFSSVALYNKRFKFLMQKIVGKMSAFD